MASDYRSSTTDDTRQQYATLLGFWKETWFRAWIVIEIVLFAGGYLISRLGTQRNLEALAGEAPDVHLALGGVMGTLGIVFGFFLALAVLVSVWLRLQTLLEPDVSF